MVFRNRRALAEYAAAYRAAHMERERAPDRRSVRLFSFGHSELHFRAQGARPQPIERKERNAVERRPLNRLRAGSLRLYHSREGQADQRTTLVGRLPELTPALSPCNSSFKFVQVPCPGPPGAAARRGGCAGRPGHDGRPRHSQRRPAAPSRRKGKGTAMQEVTH